MWVVWVFTCAVFYALGFMMGWARGERGMVDEIEQMRKLMEGSDDGES